jgi:hypothetical protein
MVQEMNTSVADVFGKVEKLLEEGKPAAALARIRSSGIDSPWLANAVGVCQLRLGDARAAVDTFRRLVLTGGLIVRDDVPAVFRVNFATALLADGNLEGGLRALDEIREDHPAVRQIRDTVRRWKASMTLWQRVWWFVGGKPPRPLVLDDPLGRL